MRGLVAHADGTYAVLLKDGVVLYLSRRAANGSQIWITDTDGRQERDPVLARIGYQLPATYLVGWGVRDDSFTSAPDGSVAWLEGSAYSTTLELHLYAVLTVFGDDFESGSTTQWSATID